MEHKSISTWLFVISVLISIATNIATTALPDWARPYLWLAWPVRLILIIISLVLSSPKPHILNKRKQTRNISAAKASVEPENFGEQIGSTRTTGQLILNPETSI